MTKNSQPQHFPHTSVTSHTSTAQLHFSGTSTTPVAPDFHLPFSSVSPSSHSLHDLKTGNLHSFHYGARSRFLTCHSPTSSIQSPAHRISPPLHPVLLPNCLSQRSDHEYLRHLRQTATRQTRDGDKCGDSHCDRAPGIRRTAIEIGDGATERASKSPGTSTSAPSWRAAAYHGARSSSGSHITGRTNNSTSGSSSCSSPAAS
nr:hypothetical protein CFP56_38994 [Quercus suber]